MGGPTRGHRRGPFPDLARAIETAIRAAALHGDAPEAMALLPRLAENAGFLLRLASGSAPLQPAPVDLGDLLMGLLPMWNRAAPQHSFELALLGEIPTVVADAERVERALDRLLAVTVRMTPDGGTVRVSVRPRRDEVVVSVRHYGVSLAEAHGADLFDLPDADDSGVSDGCASSAGSPNAALDLTLARTIVERHGGRAWTERPDAGAARTGVALMTAWPLVPSMELAGEPPDAPGPASREPHAPIVRRTRQVVLVVEEDVRMGRFLKANIETQGFRAIAATETSEARRLADLEAPDLVLLDGRMAAAEGYNPLRRLLADAQCPILVLARESDPLACADALDIGAADWLARPFSTEELLARMRAALRKQPASMPDAAAPPVTCGELTIDFAQRRVSLGGDAVALSKTEYKLLRALAQQPGMVLSHDVLLERVWGPGYGDAVAFVWVYIRRLRRKIEPDPANPRYILTVPGVGYRLARS